MHVVLDDGATRIPMRSAGAGTWHADLPGDIRGRYGQRYELEVRHNGTRMRVPDPLARVIEPGPDGNVSRFGNLEYAWRHRFRAPPFADAVIYEAHVPALSRHPSMPVADERARGTYVGARSPGVLRHLERLGAAVELLPLHADDHFLGQDWGYFSTAFHAPTTRYATDPRDANRELMALIDALHGRGIPVIVDVVYNHGGAVLAAAWGRQRVYRARPDGSYCDGSGCGPTIKTEEPLVRRTVIDSLQHLVQDYRVDGFRFDLGALHDIDTMLAIDRELPGRVYLTAEPWALGGAQWGKGNLVRELASTRWAVWNDDFREPGRALVTGKCDQHTRDRLMLALTGTHVDDGGWTCRPQQSVNYLSCHDGKTLADLVGGDVQRQFLGVLLVLASQGVPMLHQGTELMHSIGGEHNSYDRPDLNQIDWQLATEHADLVRAVAALIDLRRRLPHLKYTRRLVRRNGSGDDWDIDWHFPDGYPHADNTNALGFALRPPRGSRRRRVRDEVLVLLNGSTDGASFHLPDGTWQTLVDGRSLEVSIAGTAAAPAVDRYYVHPGTGVLLAKASARLS